jgi:hypothetical protein
MVSPVVLYPLTNSAIYRSGVAVDAIYAGSAGGRIINPPLASDQNIANVEVLWYDLTAPAGTQESATTFPLQPGQYLDVPAGLTRAISVNAVTTGHRFGGYAIQPPVPYPPVPVPGTFPPSGPTSLLKTIPSYLYEQYQDDDNLQAFVASYNTQMQQYVDWFNQIGLPVYTGSLISGSLLDWVAQGLYGIKRPSLSSGTNKNLGPYNTTPYNTVPYNGFIRVGTSNVTVTNDDIFKRIMTWQLYRGDGKVFNLIWLKRRIIRFLTGVNGTAPRIDNTYSVSAAYGSRYQVNVLLPADPNSTILKEAIDSGVLNLPFQLTFSVTIAP